MRTRGASSHARTAPVRRLLKEADTHEVVMLWYRAPEIMLNVVEVGQNRFFEGKCLDHETLCPSLSMTCWNRHRET